MDDPIWDAVIFFKNAFTNRSLRWCDRVCRAYHLELIFKWAKKIVCFPKYNALYWMKYKLSKLHHWEFILTLFVALFSYIFVYDWLYIYLKPISFTNKEKKVIYSYIIVILLLYLLLDYNNKKKLNFLYQVFKMLLLTSHAQREKKCALFFCRINK